MHSETIKIVQVGNFQACSIQSQPYTEWLSSVSPPQEIFGWPECGEWQRDQRQVELSERLGNDLFWWRNTKAGPTVWYMP